MKKTTIILFSFALLLLIAGGVLCLIGTNTGNVFDNTVSADSLHEQMRHDIAPEIKTISVMMEDVSDVSVNVHTTDEAHSYMLTTNVNGSYIKQKSSKELSITDKTDYLGIAIDAIQNPSGLRNLLFREKVIDGPKSIELYISKSMELTSLKIALRGGDVTVENLQSNTSYSIEVDETSEHVVLRGVTTGDQINMTVGTGTVSVENSSAAKMNVNINDGSFHLSATDIAKYYCNLTTEDGEIYYKEEASGSREDGSRKTYQSEATPAGEYTDLSVFTRMGSIHIKEKSSTEQTNNP